MLKTILSLAIITLCVLTHSLNIKATPLSKYSDSEDTLVKSIDDLNDQVMQSSAVNTTPWGTGIDFGGQGFDWSGLGMSQISGTYMDNGMTISTWQFRDDLGFYGNWADSEERKECLRESSRQNRNCVVGEVLLGFVLEMGVLAVGVGSGPLAPYVIGVGSTMAATTTAAAVAQCAHEKEIRDIDCPA